jgi:hypothetical protein
MHCILSYSSETNYIVLCDGQLLYQSCARLRLLHGSSNAAPINQPFKIVSKSLCMSMGFTAFTTCSIVGGYKEEERKRR